MTEANVIKVVAISGSMRRGSYNTMALQLAKRFAAGAGAEVQEIDLRELGIPLYDGDVEAKGFPEPVQKLKSAVEAADVLVIASPEYNYSVPGVLKNAIDWLSRGNNSFSGKVAAIFGVSTGPFGTARGQYHLRQILTAVNVLLLPQPQVYIGSAREAFASDGMLKNPRLQKQLEELITKTIGLARKLNDTPSNNQERK